MDERDANYSQKRIDESWKEQVSKEKKVTHDPFDREAVSFSGFVSSLGIQALMRMGELKPPGDEKIELDLAAAQEAIDLLLMIKEKTKGNLSKEEEELIESLIADLQLKFVQHKSS